jgi:uncharacterized protein involved in exopolysaccharide biosynthesis
MFDLEVAIAKWRQEMATAGLTADVLIELEEHLREDIAQQIDAGTSASAAFHAALARMGDPKALRNEFDLIAPPSVRETLRRHKWKLALCCGLGLATALLLPIVRPAPYQSEAKLFIRSVAPTPPSALGVSGRDTVSVPVSDAEQENVRNIMHQKVSILTGSDLARRVAEAVGPKKVLRNAGGGDDVASAAALIQAGLAVRVPTKSSVMRITFRHPDSAVLEEVLREVVDQFIAINIEPTRWAWTGPRGVAKVAVIQRPSAPIADSAALARMQVIIVLAGVMAGFGWVFAMRRADSRLQLAR